MRRFRKSLKRNKSLECTCEKIPLSPNGTHGKYESRCDFCSEKRFIKSVRTASTPAVTTFN